MKIETITPIKNQLLILITIFVAITQMGMIPSIPDEGMYPLSELEKIDLQKAGLKIDVTEIYNPDGISLVDALVKIGGCTGSFISNKGLIITNHHCAFGVIRSSSTTETNYLQDGFIANSVEEEIPAFGYSCRITESYKDVSEIILAAVEGIDDLGERSKIISKKMKEIAEEASDSINSMESEVSEMFAGKSYILFNYRIIKDVRLVYAPPLSIGNFGGESDNWVWPRHTGDFSLLRAYVAPDGSASDYSENNIPYKPQKYLKVNPDGVKENDFVFILGYPGKTYRHQPSQFLEYQEDFQLPYITYLYDWMIQIYEEIASDNPDLELKFASRIKGLSNTTKNYKGKMLGLKSLNLVEKKQLEEDHIQLTIESDEKLKNRYSTILNDIDAVYSKKLEYAEANLWFSRLYRFSSIIYLADFLLTYQEEIQKPDSERKSNFRERNLQKTKEKLKRYFTIYNEEFEIEYLTRMFYDALDFSETSRIEAIDKIVEDGDSYEIIESFILNKLIHSKLIDEDRFNTLMDKSPEEFAKLEDPALLFAIKLSLQHEFLSEESEQINGALSKLLPEFLEAKKILKQNVFIPDANGTLRLTFGYIKGYTPADAVYYSPITTLNGVIEKSHLGEDYVIPEKLRKLHEEKDFGRFNNQKAGGIPVGILYNTDTTGGSSGSPVLNSYGELVGVNFDRAFEATINDFAWDNSYSRSIGVDIRYILWIIQKFADADYLLQEIGVKL